MAMKRSLILIWDNRKLSVLKEFINTHCLKNYAPTVLVCWKELRQCYLEIQSYIFVKCFLLGKSVRVEEGLGTYL